LSKKKNDGGEGSIPLQKGTLNNRGQKESKNKDDHWAARRGGVAGRGGDGPVKGGGTGINFWGISAGLGKMGSALQTMKQQNYLWGWGGRKSLSSRKEKKPENPAEGREKKRVKKCPGGATRAQKDEPPYRSPVNQKTQVQRRGL